MRTTKLILSLALSVAAFSQCALVYNPFTNQWNCGGASGTVGGAANLTTAGAIPYVSAPGVLNQDASNLFWDATNKRLGVGTGAPITKFQVSESTATTVAGRFGNSNGASQFGTSSTGQTLVRNEASAQSIGFFLNSEIARFAATTGNLLIGGTTDGNYKLEVANSGTSGTARFYDATATTGSTKLVVRAGAGQSGNLQEWQNNAGTTLASISSAGVAAFAGVSAGSLSTTGSALVGAAGLYYWTGRSTMSSSSDGIIAFTNNAGTNFDRLIFGVGNASFPSLKRSGSVLEVRLADDSAYAALQAVRLQTAAQTVSQLPAAAGNAGSIQYVTDANATTIGSTVAGGGANKVMVWSDGTNWKIYAN